jgi:hypothetical protein
MEGVKNMLEKLLAAKPGPERDGVAVMGNSA